MISYWSNTTVYGQKLGLQFLSQASQPIHYKTDYDNQKLW
jgi:hypothetical protein